MLMQLSIHLPKLLLYFVLQLALSDILFLLVDSTVVMEEILSATWRVYIYYIHYCLDEKTLNTPAVVQRVLPKVTRCQLVLGSDENSAFLFVSRCR